MFKFKEIKDEQLEEIIAQLEFSKSAEGLAKEADEIFVAYDKDKNGVLDRKEMRNFMGNMTKEWKLVFPMTDEFLDDLFRDIDKDHSNTISKEELKVYLSKYAHVLLAKVVAEREARLKKIVK